MPNGDCTIGAQLKEQNVAQGEDIGEVKTRVAKLEECVHTLSVTTSVIAWKVGAIIAGLIMLFDVFVRPSVASLINGGG